MYDEKVQLLLAKSNKLYARNPPTKQITIRPTDHGTVYLDGIGALGERIQRPVRRARRKQMEPNIDHILNRGDPIHVLDLGNGTFLIGDGQLRARIAADTGRTATFNAKMYTLADLKAAGLSSKEWVRLVSSDGKWSLGDLVAVSENSKFEAAFNVTGLNVVWTPEDDATYVIDIAKAILVFKRSVATKTLSYRWDPSQESVLEYWETAPKAEAVEFCSQVRWWEDTLVEAKILAAADAIHPAPLFHHRMLTFVFHLWDQNSPAKDATLLGLGRWWRDRPDKFQPFFKTLTGSGPGTIQTRYNTLLRGINEHRPDKSRLVISTLNGAPAR